MPENTFALTLLPGKLTVFAFVVFCVVVVLFALRIRK